MREESNFAKGMAAGIAGGLVASFVMNQFQAVWGKLMEGEVRSHGAQSLQQGTPSHGIGRELQERGSDEPDDNAAVRAGAAVAELLFHQKLSKSEKETAGAVAHYAMGVTSGAIYGAVAELAPQATAGEGVPFGAAVWLIADEAIVPALGLSKPATSYPLSTHIYAFASHLVYGVTTEVVRRRVRRALSSSSEVSSRPEAYC
jgi:putative membrane protein